MKMNILSTCFFALLLIFLLVETSDAQQAMLTPSPQPKYITEISKRELDPSCPKMSDREWVNQFKYIFKVTVNEQSAFPEQETVEGILGKNFKGEIEPKVRLFFSKKYQFDAQHIIYFYPAYLKRYHGIIYSNGRDAFGSIIPEMHCLRALNDSQIKSLVVEDKSLPPEKIAIEHNDTKRFEELIQKDRGLISKIYDGRETLLFYSSAQAKPEFVKIMVKHGADVNSTANEFSRTALTIASGVSDFETVKFLVEKGAKVNVFDSIGLTPLMAACGMSVNTDKALGLFSDKLKIIEFLLQNGANVNDVIKDGTSCLHHAAYHGSIEMVELLLKYDIDLSKRSKAGQLAVDSDHRADRRVRARINEAEFDKLKKMNIKYESKYAVDSPEEYYIRTIKEIKNAIEVGDAKEKRNLLLFLAEYPDDELFLNFFTKVIAKDKCLESEGAIYSPWIIFSFSQRRLKLLEEKGYKLTFDCQHDKEELEQNLANSLDYELITYYIGRKIPFSLSEVVFRTLNSHAEAKLEQARQEKFVSYILNHHSIGENQTLLTSMLKKNGFKIFSDSTISQAITSKMKRVERPIIEVTPLPKRSGRDVGNPILVMLGDINTNNLPQCWDYKGVITSENCEIIKSECVVEGEFTSERTTKLIPEFPATLENELPRIVVHSHGTSKGMAYYNSWKDTSLFPIGADLVVYAYNYRNSNFGRGIDIYSRGIVPANGKILLKDKQLSYKKYKFIAKGFSDSEKGILVDIFSENAGVLRTTNDVRLIFAPGTYAITFRTLDGRDFVYKLNVSLPKGDESDNEIITITISESDFQINPKRNETRKKLSWLNEKQKKDKNKILSLNLGKQFLLDQVKSLTLAEKSNVDILNYFDLKDGELHLKESQQTKFNELVRNLPFYNLKLNGQCASYATKKLFNSYDVYSNNNGTSKIGLLNILQDTDGFSSKYQANQKGALPVIFKSNVHNGRCRDNETFLHRAKAVKGEFVNLGKGPWGQDGWIKSKSFHLFQDFDERFAWQDDHSFYLKFRKDKEGKVFAEGSQTLSDENEKITNKEIKFPVYYEDFYDDSENLKIQLNCSYGC